MHSKPPSLQILDGSVVRESTRHAADTGDGGLIPRSGRSPEEGKWQPTPIFLPGESMDRRAWRATARRVTQSQARLGD